jgi:hypothetical protein
LEENFVCVRVVQMKGVDLRLFQFDWDLTFAVVFLNADGTVYGRYGTRAGVRNNQTTHVSLPSLEKAMQRALELHRAYPENRKKLLGKRGPAPSHNYPEQTPFLSKYKEISATNKWESCIECHKVGESQLRLKREKGTLDVSDIWAHPLPESIGLRLEKDDGLVVAGVTAKSVAADADIRPRDRLVTMNGQRLISQADVQWVLHHAPQEATLAIRLDRAGKELEKSIALKAGWKRGINSWRESLAGLRPDGLDLTELSAGQKKTNGIAADQMALQVRYAFRTAGAAGLRVGDVLVGVDEQTNLLFESDFLSYLWLSKPPRKEIQLSILRKGRRMEINLPVK